MTPDPRRAAPLRALFRMALCLLALALWPALAGAASQKVRSLDGLYAALSEAKGGETILLEGGEYGKLFLAKSSKFNIRFASTVTIASADPGNRAVFSGLDLREVANLTLDGLMFDYSFKPEHKISFRPFKAVGCENLTIRNSVFDGDVARGGAPQDEGYGYAFGLGVGGGTNVRIQNNEIRGFFRGLVMGGGSGNLVAGNDIHSLRMDAMNFSQVRDLVIENNYIHDFRRSRNKGDHADMIQFWTNGTKKATENVTIRGNVLMMGAGNSTQSIFMRNDMVDRGLAGPELFYRDIVIEDNVIINGHLHGITVGETDGLTIRRNTLLRNQPAAMGAAREKKVTIPRINLKGASVNVVVEGNLAAAFPDPRPGWVMRGNMVVQDISPTRSGYYYKVFRDAMLGNPQVLDNFSYLPGGPADRPSLGASLLRPGADRARYRPRRRRPQGLPFLPRSRHAKAGKQPDPAGRPPALEQQTPWR